MKISVLIPSIRAHLLEGVYNSLAESFHQEWELIIVSPYPLPDTLKSKTNIIYIYDAGNPIRCRQIALISATGDYICYAADDVTFYPNSLDIAYNTIKDQDYKTIVVGKYLEGSQVNPFMESREYYLLKTHDLLKAPMEGLPDDYLLINTGLISTKLLKEIGGFDCIFEACAMSCVDLSIRLQNYGAKCILQKEPFFHSTHLPGHVGDHGPINDAQIGHDQPRFLGIYLSEQGKKRTVININNWEATPDWWSRRFGTRNDA